MKTTKKATGFMNDTDRSILNAIANAEGPVTSKSIGVSTEDAKESLKRLQNAGMVEPTVGKGSIKYSITDAGKEEAAKAIVPEGFEDAVIPPKKKAAKKAQAPSTPAVDPNPANDPSADQKAEDGPTSTPTTPILTIAETHPGTFTRTTTGNLICTVEVPSEGRIPILVVLTGKRLKAARDTPVTLVDTQTDLTPEENAAWHAWTATTGPVKKASTKKADRARDPRLPAAGTVLEHKYRDGRTVRIRTTETNEVVALIEAEDKPTEERTFGSISAAGTFFDNGHPVNGYVYFTLQPVVRKERPGSPKLTIDFGSPDITKAIAQAAEAAGQTIADFVKAALVAFHGGLAVAIQEASTSAAA